MSTAKTFFKLIWYAIRLRSLEQRAIWVMDYELTVESPDGRKP